jgi:hypothetical protein
MADLPPATYKGVDLVLWSEDPAVASGDFVSQTKEQNQEREAEEACGLAGEVLAVEWDCGKTVCKWQVGCWTVFSERDLGLKPSWPTSSWMHERAPSWIRSCICSLAHPPLQGRAAQSSWEGTWTPEH